MKYYIFFILSTLLLSKPSIPVPHVDITKFSGLWYEVARTQNSYQEDCVASSVEYRLQEDSTYKVFNRCFENFIGGDLIEYKGTTEASNGNSMSKISMTYYYIFTREYRVIHLEKDYSAAVVTDKEMDKVWVMSREPSLKKEKLNNILTKLEKSMDVTRLIYTPQDEQGRYK